MFRKFAISLLLLFFTLIVNGGQTVSSTSLMERTDRTLVRELDVDEFGNRLLIVAPHPDDETIATGGLIQRALRRKKQVHVIVMTNGDGFRKAAQILYGTAVPQAIHYKQLGEHRQRELLKAVARLGIAPDKVHFLGYPDGGLHRLWTDYWPTDHLYMGRTGTKQCPYTETQLLHASYSGVELEHLLRRIIENYRPSDIIYPAPQDRHDDHWATQAFVQHALVRTDLHMQEWAYLVHFSKWPRPHAYVPATALEVPLSIRRQAQWCSLQLKPEEMTVKLLALHEHQSQIRVMQGYLESFVRRNELFQKITPQFFQDHIVLHGSKHVISLDRQTDSWRLTVKPEPHTDPDVQFVTHLYSLNSVQEKRFDLYGLDNRLPLHALQGAEYVFLASEMKKDGKTIDQTSWTLFSLQS